MVRSQLNQGTRTGTGHREQGTGNKNRNMEQEQEQEHGTWTCINEHSLSALTLTPV